MLSSPPSLTTQKLQLVQNVVTYLLASFWQWEQITSIFLTLHWLQIYIQFKILVLTKKWNLEFGHLRSWLLQPESAHLIRSWRAASDLTLLGGEGSQGDTVFLKQYHCLAWCVAWYILDILHFNYFYLFSCNPCWFLPWKFWLLLEFMLVTWLL